MQLIYIPICAIYKQWKFNVTIKKLCSSLGIFFFTKTHTNIWDLNNLVIFIYNMIFWPKSLLDKHTSVLPNVYQKLWQQIHYPILLRVSVYMKHQVQCSTLGTGTFHLTLLKSKGSLQINDSINLKKISVYLARELQKVKEWLMRAVLILQIMNYPQR